jgi:hypothetical protein
MIPNFLKEKHMSKDKGKKEKKPKKAKVSS